MAYIKIITKAPEDIYGDDTWFLFAGLSTPWQMNSLKLDRHPDAMFVHWSLLNDKERDDAHMEYLLNKNGLMT